VVRKLRAKDDIQAVQRDEGELLRRWSATYGKGKCIA